MDENSVKILFFKSEQQLQTQLNKSHLSTTVVETLEKS